MLQWKDEEKLTRIWFLTMLFASEKIETEDELRMWLNNPRNIEYLKKMRGIGNKTADYLKMLSGISTTAIDRHLIRFIRKAGVNIKSNDYSKAHRLISQTAKRMRIKTAYFDYSIWFHMSRKKK